MSGAHASVSGMHTDSGILLYSVVRIFRHQLACFKIPLQLCNALINFFLLDLFTSVLFEMKFGVRTTADERLVTVSVRRLLNFEECLEFVRLF